MGAPLVPTELEVIDWVEGFEIAAGKNVSELSSCPRARGWSVSAADEEVIDWLEGSEIKAARLGPGSFARCVGLTSDVALNGKCCRLLQFMAAEGRWRVLLKDGPHGRSLRPANLLPLSLVEAATGSRLEDGVGTAPSGLHPGRIGFRNLPFKSLPHMHSLGGVVHSAVQSYACVHSKVTCNSFYADAHKPV
ncbi:unnamed protein product [Polarella glacialis]|uniref:Uncharacterized protein n=1 Tax=Polarella glacialis TaxID=89957 RepID=A0A813E516_POLGL|nr:unnamed protein product [Polarella glacialis]